MLGGLVLSLYTTFLLDFGLVPTVVQSCFSLYYICYMAQWVRSLDLTTHTSLSPIRRGFAPGFANYKKGCTRLAAASDKVYQLLAHGRWFSPGTLASSTTKTGRHDIAEILWKVALNTKNHQINHILLHIINPGHNRLSIKMFIIFLFFLFLNLKLVNEL
jgi:hypothetical protein